MDQERIRELADLCRLLLDEGEIARAEAQISQLLGYFAQLEEVDTEAIDTSPYPCTIPNRMRSDEPGPVLDQKEVLANAPAKRAGQFLVPRVVES